MKEPLSPPTTDKVEEILGYLNKQEKQKRQKKQKERKKPKEHKELKKRKSGTGDLRSVIRQQLQLAKEQDKAFSGLSNVAKIEAAAKHAHSAVEDLISKISAAGLFDDRLPGPHLLRALPWIDFWQNVELTHPRTNLRQWIAARGAKDLIENHTDDELVASGNVLAIAQLIYEGVFGLPSEEPANWLYKSCQNVLDKDWISPGIKVNTKLPDEII